MYRARDPRLERDVAIKVLPSALASDPQFRERFEREARAVAALNHPHICTIHDVGRHDPSPGSGQAIDYFVMELLEGQTLADRLGPEGGPKGPPLRIEEALHIAIQIADALDKAHRAGVIHRDLKPGNIMLVRRGGPSGPPDAKLLDFGLAKTGASAVAGAGLSMLPTTPAGLTVQGTILGTFQYMAPEQLEGQEADSRTDIFAFGAVLYEMLTGRKAFAGKSHASLIGAILKDEPPPVSSVQPLAVPSLDHIVQRCLAKDPDERWQTTADLMRELKWLTATSTQASAVLQAQAGTTRPIATMRVRERIAWACVAALLLAGAVASVYLARMTTAPEPSRIVFSVESPDGMAYPANSPFATYPTISPDGRQLVFVVRGPTGANQLAVRTLGSPDVRTLAETDAPTSPFWSPDSRAIAFFSGGQLKRVDASGGTPQTLCLAADAAGGTWSRDGIILFTGPTGGLFRVAATGGEPAPVTTLDASQKETSHQAPWFLPDGRRFLSLTKPSNAILMGSLDSPERKEVLRADSKAVYAATGHLLFIRGSTLMAQPFDADRADFSGDAFRVADNVGVSLVSAGAAFSVSDTSVLVYWTRLESVSEPAWFDRSGKPLGSVGEEGRYTQVALAPDGTKVALSRNDEDGQTDTWLLDLARGISTRFTFERSVDPVWSPDGRSVAFARRGNPNRIYRKSVDGGDELLVWEGSEVRNPDSWSPDGRLIAYHGAGRSIGVVPLTGDAKPMVWLDTPFMKDEPHFSPDGRWMAYQSNEAGQTDVYVEAFPGPGQKIRISTSGGGAPRWRADGRELFYLIPAGTLMAVALKPGPRLEAGVPQPLFQTPITNVVLNIDQYDVTGDGQRFLVLTPTSNARQPPITVVVNWTAGLER